MKHFILALGLAAAPSLAAGQAYIDGYGCELKPIAGTNAFQLVDPTCGVSNRGQVDSAPAASGRFGPQPVAALSNPFVVQPQSDEARAAYLDAQAERHAARREEILARREERLGH